MLESTRRSSVVQYVGSVSRARSAASSRSTSSIWWRIAARTAGGPATRSRAMNAKWSCWERTCSPRTSTELSMMFW